MSNAKLIDIEIDGNGNISFVVAGMIRHGSLAALADDLYDRPVRNNPASEANRMEIGYEQTVVQGLHVKTVRKK